MLNKVLIGTGVAGLTIGSGVGIYQYLNQPKSTQENKVLLNARLVNEGFELLTLTENDSELTKVLVKYQSAKKDTFGTSEEAKNAKASTLIEKCQVALSSNANDDVNYKLARQWCVKEKTVQDIFGKSGWKILDSSTNDDKDGHWSTKVKAHKESNSQNKFSITLAGSDSANIAEIKGACKKLNITEIKTTSEDFNKKFEQIKEWCAIKA